MIQVNVIALVRNGSRQLVFVNPGMDSNCPPVGATVILGGQPWKVVTVELRNVFNRFPEAVKP